MPGSGPAAGQDRPVGIPVTEPLGPADLVPAPPARADPKDLDPVSRERGSLEARPGSLGPAAAAAGVGAAAELAPADRSFDRPAESGPPPGRGLEAGPVLGPAGLGAVAGRQSVAIDGGIGADAGVRGDPEAISVGVGGEGDPRSSIVPVVAAGAAGAAVGAAALVPAAKTVAASSEGGVVAPAALRTAGPVTEPTPAVGPVAARDAAAGLDAKRRSRRKVRRQRTRSRMTVRHVSVVTVGKVSLIFYLLVVAVIVVASVLLWYAANAFGTLPSIEKSIKTLFDLKSFTLHPTTVAKYTAAAGGVIGVAGTIANILAALMYNLICDIVGGIRVDVEAEARD